MIVQRATTHEHEVGKSIILNVKFDDGEHFDLYKRCLKCASFMFHIFPTTTVEGKTYLRAYDYCTIGETTRQEDCIGWIEKPEGLI